MERADIFKLADKPVTIIGPDIQIGQKAPEFIARAQDWSTLDALASTNGKVRIIAAVPSMSTSVCDTETKRFNQEAAALDKDIAILTISTDLPYTLKNWCGAARVDKVTLLSDAFDVNFGEKYGVLIKERRIFRRAVFVVDRKGKVVYAAYMPVLGEEPKYDEVLAAAKKALAS